jgi:hypothetical protein
VNNWFAGISVSAAVLFEVTHTRIAQTRDFHIDREATRVQSAEEEAQADIVSNSMMTSERKVIRVVYHESVKYSTKSVPGNAEASCK